MKKTEFSNFFRFFALLFSCARIADSLSHVAIIACSSGSTGLPKSISLSHAMLTYVHTNLVRENEFDAVMLCFSSLYWTSGTWSLIKSAFKFTRVLTSHPFSTDQFYHLVDKYKVTQLICTNLITMCVKKFVHFKD